MLLESYAITDAGNCRKNNEDNFFLCGQYKQNIEDLQFSASDSEKRELYVYAVCDGLGGEDNGETASLLTVSTISDSWNSDSFDMGRTIAEANNTICREIMSSKTRMSSTVVLLEVHDRTARIANVGDSRAYLFRNGSLTLLSKDHTLVNRLIQSGIITPEEAETHRDRHKLTQSLGIFKEEMVIEPYFSENTEIKPGDIFLLCSDGVTDVFNDIMTADILKSSESLKEKAERLVSYSLENGSHDNITVLLCEVKQEC